MRKKLLFLMLILMIVVPQAFSQVRLDLGLTYPFGIGVVSNEVNSSGDTENVSQMLEWVFLVPEVGISYQFDLGPIKLGAGLRGYSLILETLMWPDIYAEFEFSRFVLNANIGGLGLIYFGLLNGAQSGGFIIPDVSLSFKLGDTFRISGGAMGLLGSDLDTSTVPYVIYLAGRFNFLFK